jgi:hypothetical protein
MSSPSPPTERGIDSTPEFDLDCLFDDMNDPSELTVFTPEGNATATEWITVDRSAAVALDRIR